MSQFFVIHPANPQARLIKEAIGILKKGGVIVYPTDSAYALGCQLANKEAITRIRQIRELDDRHNFTLVCRDLSEISHYATIDNASFRLLKANTPGPYTFLLKASKEVPKRLWHPKKSTIGIRIPDSKIVQALLEELNEPIMSVTFVLPDQDYPIIDPRDIYTILGNKIDLIIDGGPCGSTPTTIIDLVEGEPKVIRHGKGSIHHIN